MPPLRYHDGQRAVQREANTVPTADKLSTWVGPVVDFAHGADLIVLAAPGPDGLRPVALSGPPPLVAARREDDGVRMRFPAALRGVLPGADRAGGLVINLAEARRSRVSGPLLDAGDGVEMQCAAAFTNCRKYMAPSVPLGEALHIGPEGAEDLGLGDPWIADVAGRAETAFLATLHPEGTPDVSHRGGPPGFLRWDPVVGSVAWTEYLGDGMFLSTGNIRTNGVFSLVALDFETGDALELAGSGAYTNLRTERRQRVDALIQAAEPFPVQGGFTGHVRTARRLRAFSHPRRRSEHRARVTSCAPTAEQSPT